MTTCNKQTAISHVLRRDYSVSFYDNKKFGDLLLASAELDITKQVRRCFVPCETWSLIGCRFISVSGEIQYVPLLPLSTETMRRSSYASIFLRKATPGRIAANTTTRVFHRLESLVLIVSMKRRLNTTRDPQQHWLCSPSHAWLVLHRMSDSASTGKQLFHSKAVCSLVTRQYITPCFPKIRQGLY